MINIILLTIAIEAGTIIDVDQRQEVLYDDFYSNPFYLLLEPDLELFNIIHIGGTMRVNMYMSKHYINFCPTFLSSTIYINAQLGGFIIQWLHNCGHGIAPWDINCLPDQLRDVWHEEISIRFEIGV